MRDVFRMVSVGEWILLTRGQIGHRIYRGRPTKEHTLIVRFLVSSSEGEVFPEFCFAAGGFCEFCFAAGAFTSGISCEFCSASFA
jgi:hypothetical protein